MQRWSSLGQSLPLIVSLADSLQFRVSQIARTGCLSGGIIDCVPRVFPCLALVLPRYTTHPPTHTRYALLELGALIGCYTNADTRSFSLSTPTILSKSLLFSATFAYCRSITPLLPKTR